MSDNEQQPFKSRGYKWWREFYNSIKNLGTFPRDYARMPKVARKGIDYLINNSSERERLSDRSNRFLDEFNKPSNNYNVDQGNLKDLAADVLEITEQAESVKNAVLREKDYNTKKKQRQTNTTSNAVEPKVSDLDELVKSIGMERLVLDPFEESEAEPSDVEEYLSWEQYEPKPKKPKKSQQTATNTTTNTTTRSRRDLDNITRQMDQNNYIATLQLQQQQQPLEGLEQQEQNVPSDFSFTDGGSIHKLLKGCGMSDILMPKKQFVKEHKKLLKVLKEGKPKALKKEYNEQKKELKEQLKGGKKEKWIQKAVSGMKEGAFTKQALRKGETPSEYASDVLEHPEKHTLKTRRRAQFLKNITGGKKSMKEVARVDKVESENPNVNYIINRTIRDLRRTRPFMNDDDLRNSMGNYTGRLDVVDEESIVEYLTQVADESNSVNEWASRATPLIDNIIATTGRDDLFYHLQPQNLRQLYDEFGNDDNLRRFRDWFLDINQNLRQQYINELSVNDDNRFRNWFENRTDDLDVYVPPHQEMDIYVGYLLGDITPNDVNDWLERQYYERVGNQEGDQEVDEDEIPTDIYYPDNNMDTDTDTNTNTNTNNTNIPPSGGSKQSGFIRRMMAEVKLANGSYKNPTNKLSKDSTMNKPVAFDYFKMPKESREMSKHIMTHLFRIRPYQKGERQKLNKDELSMLRKNELERKRKSLQKKKDQQDN